MSTTQHPSASEVRVGAYNLALEGQGIRLTRHRPLGTNIASPLLVFQIDEVEGTRNHPVKLHRLVAGSQKDQALFHGYTRQQISFDGEIQPDQTGEGLRVAITVLDTSEPFTGRVSARLNIPADGDPWWLVPGVFYGDNRPGNPGLPRPAYSEVHRDPKRLLSPQWAFRADRAALPMVSLWNHGCYAALHCGTTFGRKPAEEYDPAGICGLGFGQDDGEPYLAVHFPYREAPVRYAFCEPGEDAPAGQYFRLEEAESLRIEMEIRVTSPARNAHVQPLQLSYERSREQLPPAEAQAHTKAARLASEGMLRWHYDRKKGALYETSPLEWSGPLPRVQDQRRQMHSGWLSGALPAYVLLWSGREREDKDCIHAGTTVLNRITRQTAPCGTLFPVWSKEQGWSCSFGSRDGAAHSRTVAEAVLFVLRALALESHFDAGHTHWLEAAVSSLNYAMGVQRDDGCFPSYFDLTTGGGISWEGTGGLPWVAALASAASMLQREHFGDVAVRAGEYYAPFVRNGLLFGTVEDQPGVPCAQDAVWAVMAYVNLYDWDRDIRWLQLACDAAEWLFSWQVGGRIPFHRDTVLGAYGIETQGGVVESVSSPYIAASVLFCYRELCRLADYTGDPYYQARLQDAVRFAVQLVAREEGQFNGRRGMVPAQLYHVDWVRPKGSVLGVSSVMTAALIGYSDLVQRNLRLPEQTHNWTELTRSELAARKVGRYAEEEIQELAGQRVVPGWEADGEDSPLGLLMGLAAGETPFPAKAPAPSPEEARTPIPLAGGAAPSRQQAPAAEPPPFLDPSQRTPVPFDPAGGAKEPSKDEDGKAAESREESGSGEIKYKIF